jgi:KDO2-lipid IV(A) lauroyltransferase
MARSGPRVPLAHRLEYVGFRVAIGLLRLLPERWALGVGAALGWLAGTVLRIRRSVTDANLARAFPDRDRAWRDRVARASYASIGREGVATFLFGGESAERVRWRTPDPEGAAALFDAAARGRGAILVTGHLGNWELAGAAAAARGAPLDAVVVRQANRLFDEALTRNRANLGIRIIRKSEAPRELLRSLRAGRVPGLLADQDARRAGVFVDFLGVPASTPRGPALFAIKAEVPLFLGTCVPLPGQPGRYRCEVEEIRAERTGDLDEDVVRLTAAHVAALAARVRRFPEHYFWQHRRWRTAPPTGASAGTRKEPETSTGV